MVGKAATARDTRSGGTPRGLTATIWRRFRKIHLIGGAQSGSHNGEYILEEFTMLTILSRCRQVSNIFAWEDD